MSDTPGDEVDRSDAELDDPAIERFRKIEVVRRLLKHKKDKRVGRILTKLLTVEQDNEVLKTVVLGFGVLKDKAHVPTLLPLVEHPSMRVTAAAIKTLCKLDPNMEVQTLHPLLASRDGKARMAAVLALMSVSPRLGGEMLAQLAGSPIESLRHTAVKCLETVDEATAQALVVEMFMAETAMPVLKDIARAIKKRGVSREGLERLNDYRAREKAAKPANDDERLLRDAKVAIMERLSRKSYENLDLSAGTIGTLEGMVDKQAVSLESQAVQVAKIKDVERRTGQQKKLTAKAAALKAGPRWGRLALGFAVVILLAGGAQQVWRSKAPPAPELPPPVASIPSVLGKAGERVAVDAQVLHVYRSQRSVSLMMQGPVMICAVFGVLPATARAGARVHLEGVIQNVQGAHSLTVSGELLTPSI